MTFNRFAGLVTLHALRTLVFRSRIAWLRRFQGPGTRPESLRGSLPARRRPPGVRLGLDRRSGPVGSAFLVDVADDILAIDCDSADRVEVVQEIATELQGHGYRPFGLLPVGPVTNICSSPSFVERQAGRPRTTERTSRSNPESAHAGKIQARN